MPLNEYDDLLSKQASTSQQPTVVANDYEAMALEQNQEQVSNLQQSMFVAAQKKPDHQAEVLKLSQKFGMPASIVENQFDTLSKVATEQKPNYEGIIQKTPALANWLGNPDNAAVGQDDLPALERIETAAGMIKPSPSPQNSFTQFASDMGRAVETGWTGLNASAWHVMAAYGKVDPYAAASAVADANRRTQALKDKMPDYAQEFFSTMEVEGQDFDKAFQRFTSSYDSFQEGKIIQALTDFGAGGGSTIGEALDMIRAAAVRPRGLIYSVGENLANAIPSMAAGSAASQTGAAAGAVFGPVGAAVGSLGGFGVGSFLGSVPTEVGAWVNESMSKRGIDTTDPEQIMAAYQDPILMEQIRGEAERKGVTTAAISGFTNIFAGKLLSKAGPGMASRAVRGAGDLAIQGAGEVASEFGGQVAAYQGDLKKVSASEALMEGITSLGQSVGETAIGASRRALLNPSPTKAAKELATGTDQALQAQHDAQALTELGAAVKESKTAQRIPEKIKELADQMVEQGKAPDAVLFQPNDWDNYWNRQGSSPARAAEQIMDDGGKAYVDAKASDSLMSIPLGNYLEKVAPTEHFEGLLENARTRPDGMSTEEAGEFMKALPATMAELAKEVAAPPVAELQTPEDLTQMQGESIRNKISTQLAAAGYSEKDASSYGQVYESAFKALGERMGMNPLDLFTNYGLQVTREGQTVDENAPLNIDQQMAATTALDQSEQTRDIQVQTLEQGPVDLYKNSEKLAQEGFNFYISEDPYFNDQGEEVEGPEVGQPGSSFSVAVENSENEEVGRASFKVDRDGNLVADDGNGDYEAVTVLPEYRRRGIATELYRRASELAGKPVKDLNSKTDEGRAFRDAIRDGVTFEQSSLGQPGDGGGDARGRITFGNNKQFNIELLKGADPSTFIHETGHFYLEVLSDLASSENAPQDIKDDFQTILDWFGVKDAATWASMTPEERVESHEKFARGFEAYLMEGKAPSSALREAFTKFKVWLTSVYRQLRNLNVELTSDVRNVMNRLLATEEEITDAQIELAQEPLFLDPAAVGMNEKQSEAYVQARMEARQFAEDRVNKKMMRDFQRTKKKAWATERNNLIEQFTAELNERPIYKALAVLQDGTHPDGTPLPEGTPQMKLDRKALAEQFGPEFVKALPRPYVYAREGGVNHNVAADILGFESGTAMMNLIATTPKKSVAAAQMADAEMANRHPDLLTDGELPIEAVKALHNDKRAYMMQLELEHLASNNLPVLKEGIRRITRRPPTVKAVREQAMKMIGGKKLSEIKPILFSRAEAKMAKLSGEAFAKGDFDAAFDAKQKELLNHELFRSATEARELADQTVRDYRKLMRPDEAIAKTRDVNLVDAARAVVATFGIGRTDKTAQEYLAPMKEYDPSAYETMLSLVESATLRVAPFKELAFDDFVAVKDTVDALWDLARTSKQMEIDGQKVDRDQVKNELAARIAEISVNGEKGAYDRGMSDWDKTKIGLMGMRAALRRVESWTSAMDSGKQGVFTKYVWNPISEATTRYRESRKGYLEKYLNIVKGIENNLTRDDIVATELIGTDGRVKVFRGTTELLSALLHSGNKSNLSKLLRGYGWGSMDAEGNLDASKWNAFIARMQREGVLTKEHYDYVQNVWNLLEELKPQAQKAHKEMYGHYFNEITSDAFSTPFGEYRGGYMPAVADPLLSTESAARMEKEALEKNNNSFMFPTAGRGFTKKRVEAYATPLALDLKYIPGHIDKVLRFVHIEPHVKDVARIVRDRGFRRILDGFDPTVGGEMLIPWLQRSAQQKVEFSSQGAGWRLADTFFREVRRRTGYNVMTANVTNTLQQFTGLSIAAIKVRPKYLRNALWTYVRGPKKAAQDISEKSVFMRNRMSQQSAEVLAHIDDLLLNPTKYEKIADFAKKHGYFMQAGTQNVVDTVTWSGAYDEAVEAGETEPNAVRIADAAVRQTQGSFAPEDVSRFETGTPFMRAFTMFYSYFNMQSNLLASEFVTLQRDSGLRKGAGRGLYVYTFGFMIPAVISELIVQAMAGKLDDEDDDEYLNDMLGIFFGSQARGATAMFPVIGPTINAGINRFNNKAYDDRISTSPAISMIESAVGAPASVYDAITDDGSKKRAVKDTLSALGLLTGLPLAPLARPAGYLLDVSEGNIEPGGPVDFTRGLVTGKSGQ